MIRFFSFFFLMIRRPPRSTLFPYTSSSDLMKSKSFVLAMLLNAISPEVAAAVTNVFVMPHSHDDVGWLKTVNQYFDGARRDIQWTYVDVELSTVIDSLLANPARRFSEVEMKFFTMCWEKQNDEKKD